jgi:hypothetical protein
LVDPNASNPEVYEIKPLGDTTGSVKLTGYIAILRGFDPLGRPWHRGTTYVPPSVIHLNPFAYAIVFPPANGVIFYEVLDVREIVGLVLAYTLSQIDIDISFSVLVDALLGVPV